VEYLCSQSSRLTSAFMPAIYVYRHPKLRLGAEQKNITSFGLGAATKGCAIMAATDCRV
jgi:hypothetical protein